ncbi:hypothetical protein EDEG_02041 [Edhazardia aedis USNM 41457]|uniref:Uncharacterized protein n=1 Tax=Edhazardia aedis (strain USNM 41457) TaxID=1003232 RepID=J9D813_EDHAE|nr:hypothetical protein EDEG_02041 [Edhazardia aedis USNM 41457]|eukprot:EJW03644.1 hypothetical protein EDEG_02041 [Edhazardia aedis USNM 41457]
MKKHERWRSFRKCIFGQIISMFLAISIIAQNKIIEKKSDVHYIIFCSGVTTITLLILGITFIKQKYIDKRKVNNRVGLKDDVEKDPTRCIPVFLKCTLSSILDYIAGYFLSPVGKQTCPQILIFIAQFVYPISLGIEVLLFKIQKFNYKKILAFSGIAISCLLINNASGKHDVTFRGLDLIKAFVGVILHVANTFLIVNIMMYIPPFHYTLYDAISSLVCGFFLSYFFESKFAIGGFMTDILDNVKLLCLYWISASAFTISLSPYIDSYGSEAFNGSTITCSAYFGVYDIFTIETEYKILFFILFAFCIVVDALIVCQGSHKKKKKIEQIDEFV